jgi:hypothetical protein
VSQHSRLDPERWAEFGRDQQILMIANEMNRAAARLRAGDTDGLRRGYERVLRLVDLTVGITPHAGLRRELLRWRDLVAERFLQPDASDLASHGSLQRVLLQLSAGSAKQIRYLH